MKGAPVRPSELSMFCTSYRDQFKKMRLFYAIWADLSIFEVSPYAFA
jgi:hypothetical protein